MSDNITLSDDDEEFTREDVTTLLLEVMDWVYAKAHRNRPMTEAEQKVLDDIRTALAAEQPVPTDKDSLTVQSRLDAESFREERDEARALLNGVLQDIEALRRDAERLTDEQIDSATSKERDDLLDHIYEYGTAAEGILERIRKLARAAIDAAMGDKT